MNIEAIYLQLMPKVFRTSTRYFYNRYNFLYNFSSNHFRGFRADCPTGELNKEKIQIMYQSILPDGNAMVWFKIHNISHIIQHISNVPTAKAFFQAATPRCHCNNSKYENKLRKGINSDINFPTKLNVKFISYQTGRQNANPS